MMNSVAQIEYALKYILEERANVLARQTGCIRRQRKFSGADLVQMVVYISCGFSPNLLGLLVKGGY